MIVEVRLWGVVGGIGIACRGLREVQMFKDGGFALAPPQRCLYGFDLRQISK